MRKQNSFHQPIFWIEPKISDMGGYFDISEDDNLFCKNCEWPLKHGSFSLPIISIDLRTCWQISFREKKKNQKHRSNNQPIDFFEGCRQKDKAKGDHRSEQSYKNAGGLSMDILSCKSVTKMLAKN